MSYRHIDDASDYSDIEDETHHLPSDLFDDDADCDDEYNDYESSDDDCAEKVVKSPTTRRSVKPPPSDLDGSTSPKSSLTDERVVSWWDKKLAVPTSADRLVNGRLNYSILLPPPTLRIQAVEEELVVEPSSKPEAQPMRFCTFALKNKTCRYGDACRFAHEYSQLRMCHFGSRCKKIKVIKTNVDGTIELINNDGDAKCCFKHSNESKASYMKRVVVADQKFIDKDARSKPVHSHARSKPDHARSKPDHSHARSKANNADQSEAGRKRPSSQKLPKKSGRV